MDNYYASRRLRIANPRKRNPINLPKGSAKQWLVLGGIVILALILLRRV
jgi:hypothetical protein